MISLGCAKNLVDAEVMMGSLLKEGFEITNENENADALIINTCSFIDAAQEESVDTILESAEFREHANSGQALIVAPAQATPVRARVAPAVQAATLVIRSIPELEVVAELPMRRIDQQAGEAVFETAFLPAAHSRYHLSLALQTEDGERSFAASSLWVLSLSTEPPVLLLVGKHHGHSIQEAVQRALGAGLEATVVDLGAGDEVYYEALLDHYLEEGELVIWMDGTLSERAQQAFRRFAAGGGRLVMASRKLPVSPRAGNFLRDVLHLGESRSASARKIFGVGSLEGPLFEFSADHASLELLAPAVPMLMNAAGQTAGLGVDNGTFRLVYWPFNLWQLNGAMVERLGEATGIPSIGLHIELAHFVPDDRVCRVLH